MIRNEINTAKIIVFKKKTKRRPLDNAAVFQDENSVILNRFLLYQIYS